MAVNLAHLADYFFCSFGEALPHGYQAKNLRDFKAELGEKCPAYGLIRDVSDSHKHAKLDRYSARVSDARQTSVGSMGYGEAEYGSGCYGSPSEVVVITDDGQKHHFSSLVMTVDSMWQNLLSN
ncbi:hypothetical protein A3709_20465 [Halioglobus sp. HI00S01]|nr:hypothetical protein A3709_20465 [Halioglobus sp. HI00S01]